MNIFDRDAARDDILRLYNKYITQGDYTRVLVEVGNEYKTSVQRIDTHKVNIRVEVPITENRMRQFAASIGEAIYST